MNIPELNQFSLVGGTALALKFGHRISDDLDLFTEIEFDKWELNILLKRIFQEEFVYEERMNPLGIFCYLKGIKVDFVKHFHPMINPIEDLSNIRMYSESDIAAMKISTILRRAKKKDFWDIAELLEHVSLDEIIGFYYKKFPEQLLLISIPQALTYFVDAEEDKEPVSLKGQTWNSIKKRISKAVDKYLE